MKDKAIEIKDRLFETRDFDNYTCLLEAEDDIIKLMLEFGHYVAEEQKKQCATEALVETRWDTRIQDPEREKGYTIYETEVKDCYEDEHSTEYYVSPNSILNSKNVCEQ